MTNIQDLAVKLVSLFRGSEFDEASLSVGRVTIHVDKQYRTTPEVTISWPSMGERSVAITMQFALDLQAAAAVAALVSAELGVK